MQIHGKILLLICVEVQDRYNQHSYSQACLAVTLIGGALQCLLHEERSILIGLNVPKKIAPPIKTYARSPH